MLNELYRFIVEDMGWENVRLQTYIDHSIYFPLYNIPLFQGKALKKIELKKNTKTGTEFVLVFMDDFSEEEYSIQQIDTVKEFLGKFKIIQNTVLEMKEILNTSK